MNEIDGEKKGLYSVLKIDTKQLTKVDVWSCRETDFAAAFLHCPTKKFDVSDTEVFVDPCWHFIALARHEMSAQLNYTDRSHAQKCFQILTIGSAASIPFDGAVNQRRNGGCDGPDTNTADIGRIKRWTAAPRPNKYSIRHRLYVDLSSPEACQRTRLTLCQSRSCQ